jgi:voltage-gated potassium channel
VFVILLASTIFMFAESQTFKDSVYWAGITATSVGYGDISPKTDVGKVVGVILAHISLFFIAPLITARLASRLIVDEDTFSHEEQVEIMERLKTIQEHLETERK